MYVLQFGLGLTYFCGPGLKLYALAGHLSLHISESLLCVLGMCEAIATGMSHPNN